MIEKFYTTTFTQKRQGYTDDKSTLLTLGTFLGHIQTLQQDRVQQFDASLNISHSVWCAKTQDIKVGDILEVGSDKYKVKLVNKMNISSTGSNQHLELEVEQTQ